MKKSQGCPGEEDCVKFKSSVDEDVCKHCAQNISHSSLSEIEGHETVVPWVSHLLYLNGLHRVGAAFHINDLTKEEWDGLLMLESVRSEIEREQMEKADLKRRVSEASSARRR